jgi:hypothetical protein
MLNGKSFQEPENPNERQTEEVGYNLVIKKSHFYETDNF